MRTEDLMPRRKKLRSLPSLPLALLLLLLMAVVLQLFTATSALSTLDTSRAADSPVPTELVPLNQDANMSYTPCASHKTCDDCLAASYMCHFCEFDFQCHAIGSPLGCVTGISTCHHLDDCKRQVPQYVGYGPPPSVVIAVLCLMVTLTCCICGIASICSVFLRRKKPNTNNLSVAAVAAAKKKKKNKTTLINRDDEELAQSQEEPLLAEISEHEIMSFEDDIDNATLERLSARRERERPFTWRSFFIRIMCITSLISITVFALMFYPRMPDYNVCNREFDWESILQSLRSLHPKIEYQVLISAINENRFGFLLEEGKADIYHNNTLVGYWKLDAPLEAKAGSISDVIAPIKIEPGYSEAYALWTAFRNNELIFRINATVSGSITWGKHKIYRISTSVDDIEFLVGAEYDRGLCKCTEYLEPQ